MHQNTNIFCNRVTVRNRVHVRRRGRKEKQRSGVPETHFTVSFVTNKTRGNAKALNIKRFKAFCVCIKVVVEVPGWSQLRYNHWKPRLVYILGFQRCSNMILHKFAP